MIKQCRKKSVLLLLILVASFGAVPVYSDTKYEFHSIPRLVAGSPLASGAVYRFDEVANGIDALVTIVATQNAKLLDIDETQLGVSAAFQPLIEVNVLGGYVDFKFDFVARETNTSQAPSIVVSALGVDAVTDYVQLSSISDYTVESDSALKVGVAPSQLLTAMGGSIDTPQISSTTTHEAISVSIRYLDSFLYRVGATTNTTRQGSLLFSPLEFVEAAVTNLNDSPVAHNDLSFISNNTTLSVASPGLLLNDKDFDNDKLFVTHFKHNAKTYMAGDIAELGEGQLIINSNGSYSFYPVPDLGEMSTSITYFIEDGMGGHGQATLRILKDMENISPIFRRILQEEPGTDAQALNIDEDKNNDGWINREELRGLVDVSYTLPDGAIIGDTLKLNVGLAERTIVIDSKSIIAGKIFSTFTAPVDGGVIDVEAIYHDENKNQILSSSASAVIDVTPTMPPTVSILADSDNSGYLTMQESIAEPTVEITLPASAVVNDRVEIQIGSKIIDIVLAPLDIANNYLSVPISIPDEGSTLMVLAKIFDEAGNVSDESSDSVIADTVAPLPPTVNPLNTTSSTPIITGAVFGDRSNETGNGLSQADDAKLSVLVNGVVYNSGDGALLESKSGLWRLLIPATDALANGVYNVTATLVDTAGNRSVDTTANELSVNIGIPQISVISVGPVTDPAPAISGYTDQKDSSMVRVLTVGNVFVCTALVKNEQWTCRSRLVMPVGETKLVASVSDQVGNIGTAETSIEVLLSEDQDNDGIPDKIEGVGDADGDGISNYLDLDSDNDTIADSIETAVDTDGDQIRDFLDLDSDNDSLSDLYESSLDTKVDNDNTGSVDTAFLVGANGIANIIESTLDSGVTAIPRDSDSDGLYDYIDRDSDNDGLEDIVEQDVMGPSQSFGAYYMQNDDVAVLRMAIDTDFDGIADYLDVDSDQDGISDMLEFYGANHNFDIQIHVFKDLDKDGLTDQLGPSLDMDVDKDGVANQKDLDSDADGTSDLVESGGVDANFDGVHDYWVDKNFNGISDDVDSYYTNGKDIDGDSIDDQYDVDFNSEQDEDGDGIVDYADVDSNGNGRLDILDVSENLGADANNNGVLDMYEIEQRSLVATGTGVFGCSLNTHGRSTNIDPLHILILFCAIIGSGRRRILRHTI